MKLIGFISEAGMNKYAIPYSDFLGSLIDAPQNVLNQVLHFLSKGTFLFATMGLFSDPETGQSIGPKVYYTDGILVWPSYLEYYIKSKNKIPNGDFYNLIQNSINAENKLRLNNVVLLNLQHEFLLSFKEQ